MNPVLNERERTVAVERTVSRLTKKEYGILAALMRHPGRVLSAEELYRTVWDAEPFDCHLIISVHIRHIREKIEKDPSRPEFIKVFWGKGYCYNMV